MATNLLSDYDRVLKLFKTDARKDEALLWALLKIERRDEMSDNRFDPTPWNAAPGELRNDSYPDERDPDICPNCDREECVCDNLDGVPEPDWEYWEQER